MRTGSACGRPSTRPPSCTTGPGRATRRRCSTTWPAWPGSGPVPGSWRSAREPARRRSPWPSVAAGSWPSSSGGPGRRRPAQPRPLPGRRGGHGRVRGLATAGRAVRPGPGRDLVPLARPRRPGRQGRRRPPTRRHARHRRHPPRRRRRRVVLRRGAGLLHTLGPRDPSRRGAAQGRRRDPQLRRRARPLPSVRPGDVPPLRVGAAVHDRRLPRGPAHLLRSPRPRPGGQGRPARVDRRCRGGPVRSGRRAS
jgi:hypothetical protein